MAQLVEIKVGFSCNNNCMHCVISDKIHERDLKLGEIKQLVNDYIQKYGQIQLTLTGGEVTLRKDFAELMSFLKEKKESGEVVFVDMQTNARQLSVEEKLHAALPVVDFYLIALHSNRADVHDEITGAVGSFEQTTSAISKIVSAGGTEKIAIQTVINRKNYQHLDDIYRFVYEEFGLKECNITFPHPIGICLDKDVVPTYREVTPYVNKALSYCLKNDIYPFIEALPYCVFNPVNRQYAHDFYNQREISSIGFAGEKDGTVDYAAVYDDGHAKYNNCMHCTYESECEGVWKEHKELYPDEDLLSILKEWENTNE